MTDRSLRDAKEARGLPLIETARDTPKLEFKWGHRVLKHKFGCLSNAFNLFYRVRQVVKNAHRLFKCQMYILRIITKSTNR
jgi:hypothetical protein